MRKRMKKIIFQLVYLFLALLIYFVMSLPFPRFQRESPRVVKGSEGEVQRRRFGSPFSTFDLRINALKDESLNDDDMDRISLMKEHPAGIAIMAIGDGEKWDFIFTIGMPYQYNQPEMIVVNSTETLHGEDISYVLNYIANNVRKTGKPISLGPSTHINVPTTLQKISMNFRFVNSEEKEKYPPNLSSKIHFALMDTLNVPAIISYA